MIARITGTGMNRLLFANVVVENGKEWVFEFSLQVVVDVLLVMLAVFALFVLLSYLLFNPARALIQKRQKKIQDDLAHAEQEKKGALELKAEYDARLHNAEQDAEEIVNQGRKKALRREEEIVGEAQREALLLRERAEKEIALEKSRVRDEVKQEMISVAAAMAGRFVAESMTEAKQEQLVEETLNEMGDDTWQS